MAKEKTTSPVSSKVVLDFFAQIREAAESRNAIRLRTNDPANQEKMITIYIPGTDTTYCLFMAKNHHKNNTGKEAGNE